MKKIQAPQPIKTQETVDDGLPKEDVAVQFMRTRGPRFQFWKSVHGWNISTYLNKPVNIIYTADVAAIRAIIEKGGPFKELKGKERVTKKPGKKEPDWKAKQDLGAVDSTDAEEPAEEEPKSAKPKSTKKPKEV